MNGIGAHEVVIESPNHEDRFTFLPHDQMILTFKAFRDRIHDLSRDDRFSYVMVFKNYGKAAGASLEHSHSQLVALPIMPRMLVAELEGSEKYYKYKDRCVFCDIIRQEIQQDIRLVCENEKFVTLAPFAPRTPFEMWILPRRHHSSYIEQDEASLSALTDIFSETLKRLDACIPGVPYNFVLHTQPLRSRALDHYHWHFEIVPKLTSIAGFEWGTGFYINPMPPEDTCRYLREVEL
jgi:UDPglucose--hexose-1-phosphate uridylyltransferase